MSRNRCQYNKPPGKEDVSMLQDWSTSGHSGSLCGISSLPARPKTLCLNASLLSDAPIVSS